MHVCLSTHTHTHTHTDYDPDEESSDEEEGPAEVVVTFLSKNGSLSAPEQVRRSACVTMAIYPGNK